MPRLFKVIAELLRTVRRRVRKDGPAYPRTADESLIADFVRLIVEREELFRENMIKASNKLTDRFYSTCAKQLRSMPDGGKAELMHLVGHDHPQVRTTAAFLLLPLDERTALTTLKRLARSSIYMTSLECEITIKEWKAGRLDVDWFMKK